MRLNPDCIRDILFAVEAQTGYLEYTNAYTVADAVQNYPRDVVLYHINQCGLYGFFTEVRHYANGDDNAAICDLSPKGHEFIQNVRNDNVWQKVKSAGKSAGSWSIGILTEAAKIILRSKLSP